MKTPLVELPVSTCAGQFITRYSKKGLAELDFPPVGTPRCGVRTSQRDVPTEVRRWHQATVAALKNVLAGRSPGKFPPFDLSSGTTFQRKVWNLLRKIVRGQTKSYGEIARAVDKPKAVRAVGGACGANPIPIFVPCHRVLAANKKLGGFSGGLNRKRELLARESVMFR